MAAMNSKVKTRGIVISNNTGRLGDKLESAIYATAAQQGATEVVINQYTYNESAEVDLFKKHNGGMVGFAYAVRV